MVNVEDYYCTRYLGNNIHAVCVMLKVVQYEMYQFTDNVSCDV